MARVGTRDSGGGEEPPPPPNTAKWEYLGVGCLSAIVGLFGGGMIAVLISKIVGALRRCAAAEESGAPCDWTTYWTYGARIGLVVVPIVSIWLFRRGRIRDTNQRG